MHRKYGNIHALDSHLNNYGGDMDGSIKNLTHGFKKKLLTSDRKEDAEK